MIFTALFQIRAGLCSRVAFVALLICSIVAFAQPLDANDSVYTPEFCRTLYAENPFLESISSADTFESGYNAARELYHSQVNRQFNDLTKKMSNDIYRNDGQNEKLCAPYPFTQQTSSVVVAQEMLSRFQQYECALMVYIANPPSVQRQNQSLFSGVKTISTIESMLKNEIDISFQALEQTLQMYTEMRMWHPVHRDMMCLIEQTKEYRNALREFVDLIVLMPVKFYNYGSRYQQ